MNRVPEPRSAARPATAGRPAMCVVLLVLCTLLGMSLDPCASAARGAEPRPAASTVPEPVGEGHHDTAMAAHPSSARAGRRAAGAGPDAGADRRKTRPPYGGAVARSRHTPATPPTPRRVVLRC
ncbi:hypothetical protein [Streptomyces niveus]|uniref:hypothetical protein n=1 Tax=Streptomyces niveus TaxID=193462 RepID=UPI000A806F4E|nr:hypothetical protein [Streptomyces niveus]